MYLYALMLCSYSSSPLLEVAIAGEFSGGEYRCDVSNEAGNSSVQATLNGNLRHIDYMWYHTLS